MPNEAEVLVSVIVPTYNHAKYIDQCLTGITTQITNFNFEVVVGDDCSIDGTQEIIKTFSARFPGKFNLLLHKKNLGPKEIPGKNNSISLKQAARGKYLAWCEGDDYWIDNFKLQKQVDFMEQHTDYNICFHKIRVVTEAKNRAYEIPDESIPDTTGIEELLKQGNFIHTPTCMLRNKTITEYPAWFYKMRAGDYAFYMLLLDGKKIKFLPEEMSVYRIHGAGAWASKGKVSNYLHEIESFKILYGPFKKYRSIIKTSIYNRYLSLAGYYRTNGDPAQTLKFELRTIFFCILYRFKPNRNHLKLAWNVVADYLGHKLKLS